MKNLLILTVSAFTAVFMMVACGTAPAAKAEAPESSKFVPEQTATEEIPKDKEAEEEEKSAEMQPPQWVADGGESASSDKERCVVGEAFPAHDSDKRTMTATQALDRGRIKFCASSVSVDIDAATGSTVTKISRCVIPATEKRDVWERSDGTVYVLVCAYRNEIDDVYEDEREMEESGEADGTDATDEIYGPDNQ